MFMVSVESNHPATFISAIKTVQERLSLIAQTFLADRLRIRHSEGKFDRKKRKLVCCRDTFECENPDVMFIEPIYSENTYRNLRSAFQACAQNEILVGQYLYGHK